MEISLSPTRTLVPKRRCWSVAVPNPNPTSDEDLTVDSGTFAFDVAFGAYLLRCDESLGTVVHERMSRLEKGLANHDEALKRAVREAMAGKEPVAFEFGGAWRLRPDGKKARSWFLERRLRSGFSVVGYPASIFLALTMVREATLRERPGHLDADEVLDEVKRIDASLLDDVTRAYGKGGA